LLPDWLPHYEREHGKLDADLRKKILAALNPFELHRQLEEGLRAILHRALHSSRPTDSLHSAPDAGKEMVSSVS
jgi:hypothetical protein